MPRSKSDPPKTPRRRARALSALASMGLVLAAEIARADLVTPGECRGGHEGDFCIYQEDYPGRCSAPHTDFPLEGRARSFCEPLGPPLTPEEKGCVGLQEGNECARPSGLKGVCVFSAKRVVEDAGPPWNGHAELTVYKCKHIEKDTSLPLVAWGVLSGCVALVGVFIVVARRRSRASQITRGDETHS